MAETAVGPCGFMLPVAQSSSLPPPRAGTRKHGSAIPASLSLLLYFLLRPHLGSAVFPRAAPEPGGMWTSCQALLYAFLDGSQLEEGTWAWGLVALPHEFMPFEIIFSPQKSNKYRNSRHRKISGVNLLALVNSAFSEEFILFFLALYF